MDSFLGELDIVMSLLLKKQQMLNGNVGDAYQILQEEEAKVE